MNAHTDKESSLAPKSVYDVARDGEKNDAIIP